MVHRAAAARPVYYRLARWAGLIALLAVGVSPPTTAAQSRPATGPLPALEQQPPAPAKARTWYAGKCRTRAGVTVVVDFQRLGGYRGHPGRTLVRCAKGPSKGRSGLWALRRTRLEPRGTAQFGNAFICRIQNRPAPNEKLRIRGNRYEEKCVRTPPREAFWAYWRARRGGPWRYSRAGASTTTVIPGGFEGWSFSLRARRGNHPKPDVTPRRPAPRTQTSALAASFRAPRAPAPGRRAPASPAATLGADWLIGELRQGSLPGPGGVTDWGLTVDALLALHAAGLAEHSTHTVMRALERDAYTFVGPALYDDPEVRIAGSVAKLLAASVLTGGDPSDFAGYDLRAETLALIQGPSGDQPGRLSDVGTGFDSSNMFGQSLAVIGLAHTGGAPDPAVDFLLDQQCRPGWFRVFSEDGSTCDQAGNRPDADATAMAVQALMAARASGVAGLDRPVQRALDSLVRAQRPDGSFGGGASTPGANTNTTGLAAQALLAGGRAEEARTAQRWIVSMQLSRAQVAGTPAAGEHGAIAYDAAGRRLSLRQGITPAARDQWRRATAQALLGLGGPWLLDLGEAPARLDPRPEDNVEPAALTRPAEEPAGSWMPLAGGVLLVGLVLAAGLLVAFRRGAHR